MIHILTQATGRPQALSILALRGLGKDLWGDVDAAAHVEAERRSWDYIPGLRILDLDRYRRP